MPPSGIKLWIHWKHTLKDTRYLPMQEPLNKKLLKADLHGKYYLQESRWQTAYLARPTVTSKTGWK